MRPRPRRRRPARQRCFERALLGEARDAEKESLVEADIVECQGRGPARGKAVPGVFSGAHKDGAPPGEWRKFSPTLAAVQSLTFPVHQPLPFLPRCRTVTEGRSLCVVARLSPRPGAGPDQAAPRRLFPYISRSALRKSSLTEAASEG